VSGQVARRYPSQASKGVAGEFAEGLPVAGQGDAPAGQVDVVQGELTDGLIFVTDARERAGRPGEGWP
jgi:hypothetical protein